MEKNRYSIFADDRFYDNNTSKYLTSYDVLDLLNKYYNQLKNGKFYNRKVLLVEDGSVNVDKLNDDGFYCIVYKQGSAMPKLDKE